jgi:hypothetical protein
LSDPNLQAALDDGTGLIYAALFVAYKYTRQDIANLPVESLNLLKRINCDLAIVYLCQRRGYDYSDKFPMVELSLETIQQLRNGERVLDLAAQEKAGLTASTHVTSCQQRRDGLVITEYRFFPLKGRTPY